MGIKPKKTVLLNRLGVFNQGATMAAGVLMLLYTDFVPDIEVRDSFGMWLNSLVIIVVFVNLIFVLKYGVRSVGLMVIRYYRRIRHWLTKPKETEDQSVEGNSQ